MIYEPGRAAVRTVTKGEKKMRAKSGTISRLGERALYVSGANAEEVYHRAIVDREFRLRTRTGTWCDAPVMAGGKFI